MAGAHANGCLLLEVRLHIAAKWGRETLSNCMHSPWLSGAAARMTSSPQLRSGGQLAVDIDNLQRIARELLQQTPKMAGVFLAIVFLLLLLLYVWYR